MNYFLHIGYDGSSYRGWQFQPNVVTVQGTIEDNLKRIFKTRVTVLGCGRTDAGVHASQYILNITLKDKLVFDLKERLNYNLPDSIVVYDVWEMNDNQHARYDATSRTYDYLIHSYHDPVLSKYSSQYDLTGFDFEAMKNAATILKNYTDFKTLCKQPHLHNHTFCEITSSILYVDEEQKRMRFSITANRFLRGMIRLCVSFILKIGEGKLSIKEFKYLMDNQIEVPNKKPAHPNGLYLSKVEYPYLNIPTTQGISQFLMKGLE